MWFSTKEVLNKRAAQSLCYKLKNGGFQLRKIARLDSLPETLALSSASMHQAHVPVHYNWLGLPKTTVNQQPSFPVSPIKSAKTLWRRVLQVTHEYNKSACACWNVIENLREHIPLIQFSHVKITEQGNERRIV